MNIEAIQMALHAEGFDPGPIDGRWGPRTSDAVVKAISPIKVRQDRLQIAAQQWTLKSLGFEVGKIDGLSGPQTQYALEQWQNSMRDIEDSEVSPSHPSITWPKQSACEEFFGPKGENQVMLVPPYPMRLAWDLSTPVHRFSINAKCHNSALRVLNQVKDIYGVEGCRKLGLDRFGGCLNVRKMRGGSSWSIHSWGAAIDFDPDHNQLRWGRDKATFAQPTYHRWWEAWEAEGWVSLGRSRNYDWMHVQAARL